MAKLFISHRTVDSHDAERLAVELRNAGHAVWLDAWRIGIGDSILEKMHTGVEEANFVLACFSGAGGVSAWMSREWFSALARQLNGENIKLLPVLLRGGRAPSIIADLKYADLGEDWDNGVQALLRALV